MSQHVDLSQSRQDPDWAPLPQITPHPAAPYAVGETLLMQWQGRTRAFRVVEVHSDEQGHTYTMAPLDLADSPQWVGVPDA